MRQTRTSRVVCVALGLALLTTGCTASARRQRSSGVRGVTLRILDDAQVDSLDTAIAFSPAGLGLARAYARQLYGYDVTRPADQATVPVPDLADGTQVSADRRTYTFTLRRGVHWAPPVDREVVAADFVSAVRRLYDPTTPTGARPYGDLIMGAKAFGARRARTISGMHALGAGTLRITLVKPVPDFLSIVAMPNFAPVPGEYAARYAVGANYAGHLVGSGPYTLERQLANGSILLVRNRNWDPASDPLRKAWVDRIEVRVGANEQAVQQALERGDADITLGTRPGARLAALQADPALSKRVRLGPSGCVDYLVLGAGKRSGPTAVVRVRRAINYAIDKPAMRAALQGEIGGVGELASTILPRTALGYRPYDLYPTPGGRGDPAKARLLLAAAGYPHGLTLGYVVTSTGRLTARTAVIRASLARVGIRLRVKTYDQDHIYDQSLSLPSKRLEHQIAQTGWCADYPGDPGRSYLVPVLDGRAITPKDNWNLGEYDNPVVNSLIDQALREPDPGRRGELWARVDRLAMQDAVWVPLVDEEQPFFLSARVRNWRFSPWSTGPDVTAIWLDPATP